MLSPTLAELAADAESAFGASLQGYACVERTVDSGQTFYDGFRLTFKSGRHRFLIVYTGIEIEVTFDDREVFGWSLHEDFAGNAFSRENLRPALPRIAASALSAA